MSAPAHPAATGASGSSTWWPTDLAHRLAAELPAHVVRLTGAGGRWGAHVRTQALPLTAGGEVPMTQLADQYRTHEDDIVLLLTDLPRRTGTQTITADLNRAARVALISVPALGLVRVGHRARALAVHLVAHLLEHEVVPHQEVAEPDGGAGDRPRPARGRPGRTRSHHRHGYVHFELPGLRGQLRLLGGLVRDNRPWRLVPRLSTATAAAAAAAAFGLINTGFWLMAQALPPLRLLFIMTAALLSMVVWLLLYNHLWDSPVSPHERRRVVLYNASTVITLLVGATIMYAVLFVIVLAAAAMLIESGYFATVLGHPVDATNYIRLVWLSTSMGVIAGALGSSLEGENSVRAATYGSREKQRRARPEAPEDGEPG